MREGRRVQRPRQTYVWPIRQLRNFVAARVGVSADDSGLDTLPLHRASHPYHVKRGANLSALHVCMRGQGCTDRDRHMFGQKD